MGTYWRIAIMVVLAGCTGGGELESERDFCWLGTLGCACLADGSCDDGLHCASGLCALSASASCGDGVVDAGEACDDGVDNSDGYAASAHCDASCAGLAPYCGDGMVDASEVCDDGADNSDAYAASAHCDASCAGLAPYCGDGVVDAGEACDHGTANSDAYAASGHCDASCAGLAPYCGDGVVDAGEGCDDGGVSGGCEPWCVPPACADCVEPELGDYVPMVGVGHSDFRGRNAPSSSLVGHDGPDIWLSSAHGYFTYKELKYFVPPGSKGWSVSFSSFLSPTEAKAAARFGAPPQATAEQVSAETAVSDTRATLERLLAGEELHFYSPASSGALSISNRDSASTFVVPHGGYIYLHLLSVPGDAVLNLQTVTNADETCYASWYAAAAWDASDNPDESYAHTCSGSASR